MKKYRGPAAIGMMMEKMMEKAMEQAMQGQGQDGKNPLQMLKDLI